MLSLSQIDIRPMCCLYNSVLLYGYKSNYFRTKKTKIHWVIWISREKKKKKYLLLWWIFWLDFLLVLHKNMLFIRYYCIIALGAFFRVEKVTRVCEKTTYPYFCFCTTWLSMIFNDSQQTLLVTLKRRSIGKKSHHLKICWFRHSKLTKVLMIVSTYSSNDDGKQFIGRR